MVFIILNNIAVFIYSLKKFICIYNFVNGFSKFCCNLLLLVLFMYLLICFLTSALVLVI